jgi:hypothetical protein
VNPPPREPAALRDITSHGATVHPQPRGACTTDSNVYTVLMHTRIPAESSAAWATLLERLADAIPELAEKFVARVAEIPAYAGTAVDNRDLHATASEVLALMIDAIADPATYPKVHIYATELGEKRAQQGIPADALASAVRLDFPIIWDKLLELAGDEFRALLAHQVETVWQVVDDYAAACYSSYVSARMHAARLEASRRVEFVAALFTPEGQLAEVQERFSRVFEAPSQGAYAIVAVNGRASATMRAATEKKYRYLHEGPSHSFLFWPVQSPTAVPPFELPTELVCEPCGLAFSAEGLAGLAAASRRAVALADHLSADDTAPLTVEKHWQRLARRHLATSGFDFAAVLDDALALGRPGEEERIRETVVTYLHTGSVTDTAEQLFAHRNTVLNRLRRFSELTGVDLHVPAQAARVVVAWLG